MGEDRQGSQHTNELISEEQQLYSWVSMAWHSGRTGWSAQQRRTSLMRPKRASSWNISLIEPCPGQSARTWASHSESFFPLCLSQRIALRVALVGSELAPAVAVQQVADRGQGHPAPQSSFELGLDLTHHQDAIRTRSLQERGQRLALLFDRHVLAPAPTA